MNFTSVSRKKNLFRRKPTKIKFPNRRKKTHSNEFSGASKLLWSCSHNSHPFHLPTLIWRLLTPASSLSTLESFLMTLWVESLITSHGCCRHCWAVGRFSGAKSRRGQRNSESSRASVSENLYFSTSNRSNDQNFNLLILFRSPYLSKKSLDRTPPVAICSQGEENTVYP